MRGKICRAQSGSGATAKVRVEFMGRGSGFRGLGFSGLGF